MISTAAHTITNASNVPMFTRSESSLNGNNDDNSAAKMPVTIVDFHGVLNFGCTSPKKLVGNRPSRAIARRMRA